MKKKAPPAKGPRPKYTHTLRTRTKKGEVVIVNYRRVPSRHGYDIEAEIISRPPEGGADEKEKTED